MTRMMQKHNDATVPVEYLIARYFVKYQRLNALIPFAFHKSTAKVVNLYVDMYGLYKTIFSRTYRTDISDYTAFTSTLINLCSHYRSYFKGIGVYTNIWIISSYNVPELSCRFVANYNKTFQDKLKNTSVKEMVELNSQLLEILCPYLPNIYFIKTSFESTVAMNFIIKKEIASGNTNPNIILSSDIYPLQLCTEFDNTVLLRPVKFKGEDCSSITTPKNDLRFNKSFWWVIQEARGNLASDANSITVSPRNFVILQALNRFPERNFQNLISVSVANRLIENVAGTEPIKVSIDMLYDANPELNTRVPKTQIESRYKTLDVEYQSYLFDESIESKVLHYENLNDPNAVQLINSQYFDKNPIDLFRL